VAKRSAGAGRKARFALGSLLLHVALLIFAATRHAPKASPARAPEPAQLEIEVVTALAEEPAPKPEAAEASPLDAAAKSARVVSSPHAAATASEAESDESDESDESTDAVADTAADAAPPASSATGPRLGLAQLGLTGPNQFVDRTPTPVREPSKKRRDVKKRLDHALAQGLQDRDTAIGFGAGSPVMRTLESAVYASSVPLNGNAMFTFVIDSSGKVVSSSLGDVSSDRDKWERVARQAAQSLAQRKLVVPKGKSVRLTVAVTSHLELPSGRDPGVEVRALGIPLQKGGGERSTRVDILNPLNPTAPFMLSGDPADIGAHPRRMVRSHVVSEEIL
jgi:hypothetical protein